MHRFVLGLLLSLSSCIVWQPVCHAEAPSLSHVLNPWLSILKGSQSDYTVKGFAEPVIDGKTRHIDFSLTCFDQESFDLEVIHEEYAVAIRRRPDAIAFALPIHKKVYIGSGQCDPNDNLKPDGIIDRLVSSGTIVKVASQVISDIDSDEVGALLETFAKLRFDATENAWLGEKARVELAQVGTIRADINGTHLEATIELPSENLRSTSDWPGMEIITRDRIEIERQLARGMRRTFEVLAPSNLLISPEQLDKKVEFGELRWVENHRVVLLYGSPEEIGTAHGQLLARETQRCIDSVLYAFGTAQTIATGRWFRDDLEEAYTRLEPHIPERHKAETRALASSINVDADLMETLNVFPELFHCSGFAVFGNATVDGKLYHGRVLDYMTTIGLQDAATTFIVAADNQIPFANVGYAGFIGSVSGMNAERVSLGEMGGHGEGQWDGVPMATLMRRALEECSTLDEVKTLWSESPRTCEYFYVFADGKNRTAVGVAATPEVIQFVAPGEAHPRLGEGIADAVVLSSGSRLEELRARVQTQYGKIDTVAAQQLMARPVAMASNLHNVLFVPEDGFMYVANASHTQPAAERPYIKIDLLALLRELPAASAAKYASSRALQTAPTTSIEEGSVFSAIDSLTIGSETVGDATNCLNGLKWEPEKFDVELTQAKEGQGDWLLRFPSPVPSGVSLNDSVAMEWYQARDKEGSILNAPAVVVVHESGSGMTVGRMIAKSFQTNGIHAFMLQLPYYGSRRGPDGRPKGDRLIHALKQGVADARRAKDAVSAMPYVDADRISLQGTSLGGFVTATVAGLDSAYHRVVILLAGGDLYNVLMEGERDAARVREELEKAGLTDDQIRKMFYEIEPLRLAHRIDPDRTWIFSGTLDTVVPPRSSKLLADAAKLSQDHHVEMLANHYSGIIFLPMITRQMSEIMSEF